jgi:hypothetical protein
VTPQLPEKAYFMEWQIEGDVCRIRLRFLDPPGDWRTVYERKVMRPEPFFGESDAHLRELAAAMLQDRLGVVPEEWMVDRVLEPPRSHRFRVAVIDDRLERGHQPGMDL